jgi:hypothetical protein
MMEALDPNYHSELAQTLLAECERLLSAAARLIGRAEAVDSGVATHPGDTATIGYISSFPGVEHAKGTKRTGRRWLETFADMLPSTY